MIFSNAPFNQSRHCLRISCLFIFFLLVLVPASAAEKLDAGSKNPQTFSLYLENDYFAGEDGGYSSGLKLTWNSAIQDQYPDDVWPHKWLYPLLKRIPFEKQPDRKKNVTFAFGQNIYTPENIEEEDLLEDDRPYAGISYLSVGFHSRKEREMNTVEVSLGLVGPSSYAEECQKAVHQVFDDIEPKGWDNQLNNEAVLELVYEYKKKMIQNKARSGFGHDLILSSGAGLGNALIYYNLGLGYRLGWNLPADFGVFPIRTVSSFNGAIDAADLRGDKNKIGVQMFFSAEGRAVMHNIFLDGNTFTDSHSVDKKPVVGDFMTGINFSMGQAQLSLAYVFRSKEFETQNKAQKFGSINFSISY